MKPRKPKPLSPLSAATAATIRAMRQSLALEQSEIARRIGINQPAYSRIECGQSLLYIGRLEQIAHALGTTPPQLLSRAWAAMRQPNLS